MQPWGCDAAVCQDPPWFHEFLTQGVGCDAAPAPSAVDAAAAAVAASLALHVLKGPREVDTDTTLKSTQTSEDPPNNLFLFDTLRSKSLDRRLRAPPASSLVCPN